MNETMAFPFIVAVIVGTAILSSIVTTMLPMLPYYWQAIKTRIKRVFTPKPKPYPHYVEQIRKRDLDLQDKMDDLQEQINNLADKVASKDKNRKHNIRRDVREYLEELRTDKK